MLLTSPIGIFTTDVNLNITSWNDWLVRATGFSEESVKGAPVIRIIPDIEKRGLYERFLLVLTEGKVELLSSSFHHYLIKIPLLRRSGKFTEMQQRVTIAPLMDEGLIYGTIVTIEDVTNQLVAEAEMLPVSEGLRELASDDRAKRDEAVKSLSLAGKTIISEVLRKIRFEHRNLSILSSAMKVLSLSDADVSDFLIEFLSNDDPELRIYSAQMLAEKNSPEVVEALIRSLDDSDVNVRYHAIESLGKLKALQAVDRLAEIALADDFFTSFPAVDALKNIGDNRAFRLIDRLVGDQMLGQPVIEALGEIGDADAVPFMTDQINRNSPLMSFLISSLVRISERYQETLDQGSYIADIARKRLNKEGIGNLLAYFEKAPENEINAAITLLGWIDDAEVSKALTKFLGHPGTNKKVIEALAASGQKIIDLVISQLNRDPETRQAAVMALGRIGGEPAVNALIPLLKDDDVCVISCGALAKIGDPKAFDDLLSLLGHHNPSIRRAAIAALNSIGHPEMAQRILTLLSDKDPVLRESSVRITGYFGFSECRELVYELCSDEDLNVRIAAIEVLPFFEDEKLFSSLKHFYSDENPKIRSAVVKSLGMMESKQSYHLLVQALNDPDSWVRYYTVRSLDMQGHAGAIGQVREIAVYDQVPFVRLGAIEYLGHMGGQAPAQVLSSLTGDPDRDIVLAAIKALGDLNHPDALPPLMALSRSGDLEIKKWAIEAMGRTGGHGTAEALQWLALTEKDNSIKQAAVTSLGTISTKESVTALINLTSDPDNREKAISALSGIHPNLLDVLCEGLNHRHAIVRLAIIEVLLRIHTPLASARLQEYLDHPDVNVRLATIRALHRLGNRSGMKKILDLRNTDPDPVVRKAVEDIIQFPESNNR